MLVVQEKNGVLRGTGVWKFPTGVVDEVCSSGYFLHHVCDVVLKFVHFLSFFIYRVKIFAMLRLEK